MADPLDLAVPSGWLDVVVRSITVLIAAFLALVVKEYADTHEWDLLACALDSVWVMGGAFVVNAFLLLAGGRKTARG